MKNNLALNNLILEQAATINSFYEDVIKGLRSEPKYLQSKYFYDAEGDRLFQQIMHCAEYYPASCEMEIFREQTSSLGDIILRGGDSFSLIELGAGDASKSVHLLNYMMEKHADFTYYPIDISQNIITFLNGHLPDVISGIKVNGLCGEYFEMLERMACLQNKRKVLLFLGANIGNMDLEKAEAFCNDLRQYLNPGDLILLGADLQKNPATILAAYNDRDGLTRRFNLNLLSRINRELQADFDLSQFEHYPTYDPVTGACKSYLIALADQNVSIGAEIISFRKDEFIDMEISQKFTVTGLEMLARSSGFAPVKNFTDNKRWFIDALWMAE